MKNKVKDSRLLSVCDLPNEKIEELGLSFRDVGRKCKNITKQYLAVPQENVYFGNESKILRRTLSNWVNDPINLVNYNGEYIGDKFGARITICTSEGYVIHDVETFCKDIKNKNRRILGKNNNYIDIQNDISNTKNDDASTKSILLYSTLSNATPETNTLSKEVFTVKVIKYNSSMLPSNNPISDDDVKYSLDKTDDNVVVPIYSGRVMDNHNTRKEVIQALYGRYGYDYRVSQTEYNNNWYVCKKQSYENGSTVFCRLSYFKFPSSNPRILERLLGEADFSTLFAAVQKANLIDTLSRRRPLTLFAPTNEAFAKLPPGKLDELLNDIPSLTKLLNYHMVAVESNFTTLEELIEKKTIKTLAELDISLDRVVEEYEEDGEVFTFEVDVINKDADNSSKITIKNISTGNGKIDIIDTVLMPPSN